MAFEFTEGQVSKLDSLDAAIPDGPNQMKSGTLEPYEQPMEGDEYVDGLPANQTTFPDGSPIWIS